jgi:RNA polymerase sigma-70 factor (ECF subfamily)
VDEVDLDDVLRRAQRHDAAALSRLVTLYAPRVYGLLYRLTGHRETAEDLLQETFLRVVRSIGRYEHTGRFEAWLFRIAANLARDRARHEKRTDELGLGAGGHEEVRTEERAVGVSDPAQRLAETEVGQRLAEAVQRLPRADREIILLRHYSGLSFREIARLLDIPLGTALARAHRALRKLRDELGAEG